MPQQAMIPTPDPTKLTTDAVDKAKVELKELFDEKIAGFRELVDEKFSGRDSASAAALVFIKELAKQINDSNTAATEKSERSTSTQIDALAVRFDDLKERLTKVEARNWSVVGGYIVGALGVAALIAAAVLRQ